MAGLESQPLDGTRPRPPPTIAPLGRGKCVESLVGRLKAISPALRCPSGSANTLLGPAPDRDRTSFNGRRGLLPSALKVVAKSLLVQRLICSSAVNRVDG
jgi:hypothetical protein